MINKRICLLEENLQHKTLNPPNVKTAELKHFKSLTERHAPDPVKKKNSIAQENYYLQVRFAYFMITTCNTACLARILVGWI